ncbi:MAG: hypothetical protein J0I21_04555 [Alphaproteobacteria bacterium]|mgnify:FL=1|nr:hypothetical protein [Rhodospirillales bacterium]MBN9508374.1 hypothetical protein [Alphaproteobacteria bacterium]ODU57298.1 MAG: hypothetical protein ABS99_05060 [Acetobacteraceae bacterium SCN 69-10]OJY67424.1 MAG: hypothetical protein BGP12_14960 [Rhodospirillales bacterium 70-18]
MDHAGPTTELPMAHQDRGADPDTYGDLVDPDFTEALLAALTGMAVRSPRRQADLAVALLRSGMTVDEASVTAALRHLERDGCIEHLVPLTDGGLLMSVTAHGIERLSHTARRYVLDVAGK